MTSISGISSNSNIFSSLAVTSGSDGQTRRPNSLIDTAAKALGMSTDDVLAALKSGKSLDDLATAQGVSQATLDAAIKADMPSEVAASSNADQIVSNIAAHKGLPEHHHHGGPPPGLDKSSTDVSGVLGTSLTSSQQTMLDSLSSLLGTDSDSLLTELQSGTSLESLVSSSGVSSGKLASILQDGLLVDTQA